MKDGDEMARILQNLRSVRKSGKTTVSTTAVPVTKIGDTSSANTTYTDTTVTDGSAWNLSAVAVNDVIKTEDGYKGLIKSVDDGNDILTVSQWQGPDGKKGTGVKPTDGQTATIHRIDHCGVLMVQASLGNTDNLRIGIDGNARADDYKLVPGMTLHVSPYDDTPNIDITRVYAIAESGSQSLEWIVVTM